MSKVVKLKQEDIEKIVNNIIKEDWEEHEISLAPSDDEEPKKSYFSNPSEGDIDEEDFDLTQDNPQHSGDGAHIVFALNKEDGYIYAFDTITKKPISRKKYEG